jgi:hypothetical protein
MKCVHCGTRSVRFSKKWWQLWCCYTQTKWYNLFRKE